MMREVILTRKHAPIKVTFIGLPWMFRQVYDWYVKRHGLKPFKSDCMVCGIRKGRHVLAKYRLKGEPWDAWKIYRDFYICPYCLNKLAFRGYLSNNRVYIDSIHPNYEHLLGTYEDFLKVKA